MNVHSVVNFSKRKSSVWNILKHYVKKTLQLINQIRLLYQLNFPPSSGSPPVKKHFLLPNQTAKFIFIPVWFVWSHSLFCLVLVNNILVMFTIVNIFIL